MNSMTGFGRAEITNDSLTLTVELSSVNRKQSDVSMSLPSELSGHETYLRKVVLAAISRGRVSAQFKLKSNSSQQTNFDYAKARSLEDCFIQLSEHLGRGILPTARDFLQIPDLQVTEQYHSEELLEVAGKALENALKQLTDMRRKEGIDLQDDIESRIQTLEAITESIQKRAPKVASQYRENLIKRLATLTKEIPNLDHDERLMKEVALFVDKSDISEELTRLLSHFKKFRDYLESTQAVGRSLDFLCQEIHREFNTIGAKAHDSELAHEVVNGKTELEKIREQVQNVE